MIELKPEWMDNVVTPPLDPRLHDIALRRMNLIVSSGDKSSPSLQAVVLSELASLGYRTSNPNDYRDSILANYTSIVDTLKEKRGGQVDYVPLFSGFPNEVPNQDEYLIKRIFGYLGCPPNWLFDESDFGADPITQMQVKSLYETEKFKQKQRLSDTNTEWINLQFVSEEEASKKCVKFLLDNLYSKSSIKEALKEDLEILMEICYPRIDPDKIVFKETLTYVTKFFWLRKSYSIIDNYCTITPTDLLRLFASLTDSDVSLSEKIKYPKLNRVQRHVVMSALNNRKNLVEDLNSYKGLWLAIGRGLHIGEHKEKYPNAFEAFDTLRNGKVVTYNSKVEKATKEVDIPTLIDLLSERPGVFARRLHHTIEIDKGKNFKKIVEAFSKVAHKVPLKNLLVLETFFFSFKKYDRRTIINKRGKIRVMDAKVTKMPEKARSILLRCITEAIRSQVKNTKKTWEGKSVWVDGDLENYTVPLQQRKASDGLLTLGRGTQIALPKTKVLRLFVWWKENQKRTDLDLSVIRYDRNMKYEGHISYTNLSGGRITHSGDIQSAPHGAAEFIDIPLDTVGDDGYIAAQVYKYSGDTFDEIECHAGWMARDCTDNDHKSFDVKTVQNKVDLNGKAGYYIPILIDLKKKVVIFTDLNVGGIQKHNAVEGAYGDIASITKAIVEMIDTRPNLYDLAIHNAMGRGGTLSIQALADITIGFDGCDLDVSNVEQVLTKLL